jgi:Predicted transmembrane and coiled-coil 2 protein
MSLTLESERYRAERLESQINDLTELHQVRKSHHVLSEYLYTTNDFFTE